MSVNPYSEKQIEAANVLRSAEETGVTSDTTEEIIDAMSKKDEGAHEASSSGVDVDTIIRMKMMDEPDWRKRAALAASIISRSLS